MSFVAAHHARIRSITLTDLPTLPEVTSSMLTVLSYCTELRSLELSVSKSGTFYMLKRSGLESIREVQWAEQLRFDHLHTLKLAGLRDAQGNLCRLLPSCPALRMCTLDLPNVSVGILTALASSCPLLSHLQLSVTHGIAVVSQTACATEEAQLPTPLRSLDQFDLVCESYGSPAELPLLTALYPFLIGSPLRHFNLFIVNTDRHYHPLLTSLLQTLPQLETLRVAKGQPNSIAAPQVSSAWDDDESDEAGNALRSLLTLLADSPPLSPTLPLSSLSTQPSTSSLTSLELVVSSRTLTLDQLSALLAHCSAVTTIHLTIYEEADRDYPRRHHVLSTFLHCLGRLGQHCPLIEEITFQLDYSGGGCSVDKLILLDIEEVRAVVDEYAMPAHAFAHLRLVREVAGGLEVLSEEPDEYLKTALADE